MTQQQSDERHFSPIARCEWWSGDKKSGFTTCQLPAAWQHVKRTANGRQVWILCEQHKRLLLDSYNERTRLKEGPEWAPYQPMTTTSPVEGEGK